MDELLPPRTRRVDVVKMDTQGSEAAVFNGMGQLLYDNPRVRMILEFWPYGLEDCGSSSAELIAALSGRQSLLWLLQHDESAARGYPRRCRPPRLTMNSRPPRSGMQSWLRSLRRTKPPPRRFGAGRRISQNKTPGAHNLSAESGSEIRVRLGTHANMRGHYDMTQSEPSSESCAFVRYLNRDHLRRIHRKR